MSVIQDFEKYVKMFKGFGMNPVVKQESGKYTVIIDDGDGGSVEAYFDSSGKFDGMVIINE